MNLPCKELKRIARANLNGRYSVPMGAYLIAGLIPVLAELPFSMLQKQTQPLTMTVMFYIADFLIVLLSVVLSAGIARLHLSIARKQSGELGMVFFGFKNHPDRYILTGLFMTLLMICGALPAAFGTLYLYRAGTSVASVLLLVLLAAVSLLLTVVIQLWYSLVIYCLLDHEELGVLQAFHFCRNLMKGHKGRLLYLYLSFAGLQILGILSFGIGSLWVEPYRAQTIANFYMNIHDK